MPTGVMSPLAIQAAGAKARLRYPWLEGKRGRRRRSGLTTALGGAYLCLRGMSGVTGRRTGLLWREAGVPVEMGTGHTDQKWPASPGRGKGGRSDARRDLAGPQMTRPIIRLLDLGGPDLAVRGNSVESRG